MKRKISAAAAWYWVLAVLPLLVTAAAYPFFPKIIPAHYNLAGEVDRYGSKAELFILPAMVLVLAPIFWGLTGLARKPVGGEKLPPEEQKARNGKVIAVTRLALLAVFNALNLVMLASAWTDAQAGAGRMSWDLYRIAAVILSVMEIVLGNLLPKCRPNSVAGVRTPWTLESEEVWYRTHRMGGFWMVGGGILSLAACPFLRGIWGMGACLAVLVLVSIVTTAYSWWISRRISRR